MAKGKDEGESGRIGASADRAGGPADPDPQAVPAEGAHPLREQAHCGIGEDDLRRLATVYHEHGQMMWNLFAARWLRMGGHDELRNGLHDEFKRVFPLSVWGR